MEGNESHSEYRLKQAQAISHTGNWVYNIIDQVFSWSDEQCRLYGVPVSENRQATETWIAMVHPDDKVRTLQGLQEALRGTNGVSFTVRLLLGDGSTRYIYNEIYTESEAAGSVTGLYGISRDVTKVRETEAKLEKANRLLAFKSQINHAIMQVHDEHALFTAVCDSAVQLGKFEIAWICIPEDNGKSIKMLAYSLANPNDVRFLDAIAFEESGVHAAVFRTAKLSMINDYSQEPNGTKRKEFAVREGFNSFISLPIISSGKVVSTLSLFSRVLNFFSADEVSLLEAAARDISFAVDMYQKDKLRLQAEEALKYRNLRLEQAQEISQFGTAEYDVTTGLSKWSKQLCKIHGVDPGNDIHRLEDWIELLHPDDRERVLKIMKDVETTHENVSFQHRLLRRDGSVRYILSRRHIEYDQDGKPKGVFAVAQDITELKDAEEKLRNSEYRLRQAQEIAHFGSYEVDIANNSVSLSDEVCRITGIEITGKGVSREEWFSFIHPDDRAYVLAENEKARTSHGLLNIYNRLISRDGKVKHVHLWAQFKFNSQGQPISLYGVLHDITEIREAQARLSQSQTNLSQVMDLIPLGIFVKDKEGRFVLVNKSFAGLYGMQPGQLLGKTVQETIPLQNDFELLQKQHDDVILSGKKSTEPELLFTDYTGKQRVFLVTRVPFVLPGKNERAVLSIVIDVTDQKAAEEERNTLLNDLVVRNKNLEQFSYIISHNLRTPVANILGIANILDMEGRDKAEDKIMFDMLKVSVQKLDSVIIDLNRVLQMRNPVNEKKELVRFSELIDDIRISVANLIQLEEVAIDTDFSEVGELFTFKSYIYSIFFNLISNSIKYRQPGKHAEIVIRSSKNAKSVTLTFKDNGLGIDLHKKGDQVFGLYKRFHHHVEGKGMGLYMVKNQVETLGGKITVESQVNNGTTFTIVLNN